MTSKKVNYSLKPSSAGVLPGSTTFTKKKKNVPVRSIEADLQLQNPTLRHVPKNRFAKISDNRLSKLKAVAPIELTRAQYVSVLENQSEKGVFKQSYLDRMTRKEYKNVTLGDVGRRLKLANVGVNK